MLSSSGCPETVQGQHQKKTNQNKMKTPTQNKRNKTGKYFKSQAMIRGKKIDQSLGSKEFIQRGL